MKNKKVFITGATGGIGEAICNKFYQKEYNLVLTSSSDEKLLSLKKNMETIILITKLIFQILKVLTDVCLKLLVITKI